MNSLTSDSSRNLHFPSDKLRACLIAGVESNLFDRLFKGKNIRISELRVDSRHPPKLKGLL